MQTTLCLQNQLISLSQVYVDDIILPGDSLDEINNVKGYLHDKFTIKDLGTLKYILGIEVAKK